MRKFFLFILMGFNLIGVCQNKPILIGTHISTHNETTYHASKVSFNVLFEIENISITAGKNFLHVPDNILIDDDNLVIFNQKQINNISLGYSINFGDISITPNLEYAILTNIKKYYYGKIYESKSIEKKNQNKFGVGFKITGKLTDILFVYFGTGTYEIFNFGFAFDVREITRISREKEIVGKWGLY